MIAEHNIKTFGRRLARALRPKQHDLLQTLLPQVAISESSDFDSLSHQHPVICLEIGFGNGDYIMFNANTNPEVLWIGAEPFLNGVASLLAKIESDGIKNIRIFNDDVRNLLTALPLEYVDAIHIICPDPWPKKRHHKRRLITQQFLTTLLKHLKSSGIIKILTDHKDYSTWIEDEISKTDAVHYDKLVFSTSELMSHEQYCTKYQARGLALGSLITQFEIKKTKHIGRYNTHTNKKCKSV